MGANPTQAQALVLFIAAFTLIAAGLAADLSLISLVLGLALLAISIVRFMQCKPWEHREE